jgi:hypothetical protein
MFVGTCFNEFPISTSEDMTQTFNGDIIEYDISIDQQLLSEISIKQKSSHDVYINVEEQYNLSIEKQIERDVYIEQQVNLDLEN